MTQTLDPTFYAANADPAAARPPLTQDIETDVCVIGGGFAGLWAARALALRGKDVVLLEAEEVASGASGQNGGFVSAGYAAHLSKIASRVGLDHARELYRLSREGVEIVRRTIAMDRRAVHAQPGRLHVLRVNDEVGLSDYAEMLSRDFGHELELWRRQKVRAALASDRYFQALHEADAFHLDPLLLARLLAAEIEDRGGRIYEKSRVISADIGGLRKSLHTEHGRVRAFSVVLAGSASIGAAFPWLAQTVLPIRTHVAVTAPLGDRVRQAIKYEGAIADTRRAGDYYHLIGDRLLWGGRISARKKPPRQLERVMQRDIARVYPQLKDVPIEYAWSGVMGYAIHLMPQIGMAQPGVWVTSAFGGHGLNTTAMAGELIASAIAEQDDRWRLFIPFGLVWSGGRAGRAVAQASYWGMQLGDWLDEAQSRAAERDEVAVSAGLAPGVAAHVARGLKRRFLDSAIGRAGVAAARALRKAAVAAMQPFIWTGRKIHNGAVALGNALVPVIWFIARAVGYIARAVGKGMEAIVAAVTAVLRMIARASVYCWQHIIAPTAARIWEKAIVPAGIRTKTEGKRALRSSREGIAALGHWSAKTAAEQSRAWRERWTEARKQRAEQKRLPAANKKKESEDADDAVVAEKAAVESPEKSSAENGEQQKKKKKKNTEKKDSIEA
jgi:glycine/D-amino acid oxidase-like deaminating enzyme